jgi:hypothetical protein
MNSLKNGEDGKGGYMAYTTEAADAGWQAAYEELKRRDSMMVTDYREEVDTLLVFVRATCPFAETPRD